MDRKEGQIIGSSISIYEGSVGSRALKRAGHCKNLKGHVFEILQVDAYNANPINVVAGRRAALTRSAIAIRDDIVVRKGGKIVKRIQCKDTPSVPGAKDTANRIQVGQYSRTNVVGTKETADAVNKVLEQDKSKTATRVKKSSISTDTTSLIAKQTLGGNPLKEMRLITKHAKKMAKGAAIVGGGISFFKNRKKVKKGMLDIDEAAMNVAADSGKSAVSAGVSSAVDVSVTMVVATNPALAPVAKPIGFATGVATGVVVDKAFCTGKRAIDRRIDHRIATTVYRADDAYGYLKRQGRI